MSGFTMRASIAMTPVLVAAAGWLLVDWLVAVFGLADVTQAVGRSLAIVVAIVVGWWLTELLPDPPRSAEPISADPPQRSENPARLAADRLSLVRAMIELRDLSTSPTLTSRLDRALDEISVERVDVPANTPFDERNQRAAGVTPTDDPGLDDLVASTVAIGYRLDGQILRPPAVAVYRFSSGTGS